MSDVTVTPISVALTGAAITKQQATGLANVYVQASTAQSSLDMDGLFVAFENVSTTATCTITLKAGSSFSGKASDETITVGTAATVFVGGKGFESAAYLNVDSAGGPDYLQSTVPTSASCYVYAVMKPYQEWNN